MEEEREKQKREEAKTRNAGGRARRALETALLEVFQRQQQQQEEQGNGGSRGRKAKAGAGAGGFDKRQLVELLNAATEEEDNDDDGGPRGARADERAVGAALKGLVSRGVLRVQQGRWCLAAPAPAAAGTSLASAPSSDDADGEADDEPASSSASTTAAVSERKKTKKWEKLPHGVSEVVPGFLYLGSARDAEDEAQLRALGITHVLNVAKEWPKPRHCTYLDSLTAYKRVPLEDRLSEQLFPLLEEAFTFIELARADSTSRVLVHCVLGKSRSAATVVAYLARHQSMTLRQAYLYVLEQRKAVVVVRPNRSFIVQLMAWERTSAAAAAAEAVIESTLSWDDVDTGFATFRDWLADASLRAPLSGSRSKKVFDKEKVTAGEISTHLWWTLGDKPEYVIPTERESELLSEYAKAHLRGEELCLIERRTSPCYRLYFDLDVKCGFADEQPRPSLQDVLHYFLPSFAAVNWKYGFHLVWDIPITVHKHRAFQKALVKHLEPQWAEEGEAGSTAAIPDFIRRHNQLSELLDSAIFTSTDTLRVLYSSKTLACKACKSRQPTGKGKHKAASVAEKKKGRRTCDACGGTGVREGRIYEWLGFFDARSGSPDAARTAALQPTTLGADHVRLVRQRVEACSIRLPPSATPPTTAEEAATA